MSQSPATTNHWRPFGRRRDHHFGSSAGDFVSNHTAWSLFISPMQKTQPTICPGIQQETGDPAQPWATHGRALCELGSFFRHTDYRDSRGIHAGNSQWEHASGGNQTGSVQHGTDVDQAALSSYSRVRDTLTVNESGDLVMRDYRIVVLRTPQHHARWAHRHQNLASYECVLPMYRHCSRGSGEAPHSVSAEYYSSRDRTTVHVVAIQPWSEIRIDFCRPLPIGEYLLFIVDESSP